MIPGLRTGPARPLRAAVLALVAGAVPALVVGTATAALAATPAATPPPASGAPASTSPGAADVGAWQRTWSWRAGGPALPRGCSPLTGVAASGRPWDAALVTATVLGVKIAAAPRRAGGATGSGLRCAAHAVRYGRLQVHARVPRAAGFVARIAFWPPGSRGSDWSGVSVPTSASAPAYATNGTGDRADGAAVGGNLAGRFHTYTVTWTPASTAVAVDGREVYRSAASYPGERWPGVSLAPTTPTSPARAYLLVDAVTLDAFHPAPGATAPAAAGAASAPTGGATAPGDPTSAAAASLLVASAPVPTTPDRSAVAGIEQAAPVRTSEADLALVGPLETGAMGTSWLIGGGCAAVAVLAGVLRAALGARRRTAPTG